MTQERLIVYTDGSCSPNPGLGGWGFIALFPDCEIHSNGGLKYTTNNVMEMTAVMEIFKAIPNVKYLHIYTDSLYVINCSQGIWQRKKNVELWQEYDKLAKGKNIKYEWVKGHNGDQYNEMVDKLAKNGRTKT